MEVLPGKWIYDEKTDPSTNTTTARARFVVCGNFEGDGWALESVYAAVANSVSVRLFLAITAIKDLECLQFDFKTAFLNVPITGNKKYYVEPPPGLGFDRSMVWLLHKALYGLRRSPRYWFKTLVPALKSLGFEPLSQQSFTQRILKKFGYDDLKPVQAPWRYNFKLPTIWEPLVSEQKEYIKVTGSFNYLSTMSRQGLTSLTQYHGFVRPTVVL